MSQGARICPHCKRRVDERRAKGLAYCLSCGQPLAGFAQTSAPPSRLTPAASQQYGTGPASNYGAAPSPYGAPASPYANAPPPSQLGGGAPCYGGAPSYGTPNAPSYGAPAAAPYGAPRPSYGNMPAQTYPAAPPPPTRPGGGSTALVLGIVFALFGVLALIAGIGFFLVGKSSSSETASESPLPTATVAVESTATAVPDGTTPTATAHHPKPTSTTPSAKPTDSALNNANAPFPLTTAFEKMDDATLSAERVCPRSSGPSGTMVIDVKFETDGRVGTTSRPPFGGTSAGECVTAQFLAIRLGPFEGSPRTFTRAITLKSPTGTTPTATATTPSSTASAHRPDAAH